MDEHIALYKHLKFECYFDIEFVDCILKWNSYFRDIYNAKLRSMPTLMTIAWALEQDRIDEASFIYEQEKNLNKHINDTVDYNNCTYGKRPMSYFVKIKEYDVNCINKQ